MFQQQLEALDENPTERKARMEARANELKDKREAERLAFVRQQYERQWRMACDPLREQESKEILKATNAARSYQIGEKMNALELEEHGVVVSVALAAEEAVEAGLDVEAHRLGVALAERLGALGRHLRFRARVRDAVALKLSAGRHRKTEEECAKLAEQR